MQHGITRDPSVCERRCADKHFTGWCFCMRAPSPSGARHPVVSRICHIFSCSRPQPQTLSSGNRKVTAIQHLSRSLIISNLVFISPSDLSCLKCTSVSCEPHMRYTHVTGAIISCRHTVSYIWAAARCELEVRGLHGPHLQKAGHVVTKSSRHLYVWRIPTVRTEHCYSPRLRDFLVNGCS